MTSMVVTIWYRAPELLFGAKEYGSAVDVWSVGCIFAELLLRAPIFPGLSELDQLGKIFHALGTPTEEDWPDIKTLPNYVEFTPYKAPPLRQTLFQAVKDDQALDLLEQMLAFDPNKRPSCTEALKHPYFQNDPKPTPPENLPKMQRGDGGSSA